MYVNKLQGMKQLAGTSTVTEEDFSTAAVLVRYMAMEPMELNEVGAIVTTAIGASTAPVITIKRALFPGGTSTALTTLTIPVSSAAGVLVVKKIAPVHFDKGQELIFQVTTAASATGKGIVFFNLQDDPETDANVSAVVSA